MQQPETRTDKQVLVDYRERKAGVISSLIKRGAQVVVGRLPVGDYSVDDSLLVERKTTRDFAISVKNGRIFRQARRLAAQPARSCFVLEGVVNDYQTGGLSRCGFHGTLISLTLVYGLPIFRSSSPMETANIILIAAEQLKRRRVMPPRRYGRKPGSIRRIQLLMLQEIPLVGPERAATLLDQFGNPAGLAAASREEISSIQGIGSAIGQRIWAAFHSQ